MENKGLEAAIRASTYVWVREKNIKNEKGKEINLGPDSPHFFLTDLYMDEADEIAVQKPSQAGVSTWAILDEIHDAKYWGINQIHTLPTADAVQKFVPSKVNEIILNNPSIRAGLSNKNIDAVNQKQFGRGFLYFKGTKSESDALMLTSDKNTYDELDKSDMQQIGVFESRQEGESSLRKKRWISTPTLPGYGINAIIETSDQKHWRFTCDNCGTEQHMQWPENVDFENKWYCCSNCKKKLSDKTIRSGKWKAKFPARKRSGYLITQMIIPWITPESMIEYYEDAKKGKDGKNMEYFYNHKLGLPYASSESRISKDVILRNLSQQDHLETNSVMGVDVQGSELYLVIGNEEGIYVIAAVQDSEEFKLTGQGQSKWDRWAELMEAYNVRYCVIDGGYKPEDSVAAAKRFPGKVWVNWYKDDPSKAKVIRFHDEDFTTKQKTFEEEIKVLTDRNRMIDRLLAKLQNGEPKFFYGAEDKAIKTLIAHVETTYARVVEDNKGMKKREWVSTGKDDLLHALVYFEIGMDKKTRYESL